MTQPTNTQPRTWQIDEEEFAIESSRPPVEMLLDGLGWCTAETLYTLRHVYHDGCTTWRVLEIHDPTPHRYPAQTALIVECDVSLVEVHEEGGYDCRDYLTISAWFLPKPLVINPEGLVGGDRGRILQFLRADMAASWRTSMSGFSLHDAWDRELPSVPVEGIRRNVLHRLTKYAQDAARQIRVELDARPIAAAYHYHVRLPDYPDHPESNTWTWRLGFTTSLGGVLTVQLQATGINLKESSECAEFRDNARVWLAIPGSAEVVSSFCPGVPLMVPEMPPPLENS